MVLPLASLSGDTTRARDQHKRIEMLHRSIRLMSCFA
jgi:hypothetical protein